MMTRKTKTQTIANSISRQPNGWRANKGAALVGLYVGFLCLGLLTPLMGLSALAHQQKLAITHILFNPQSGNIEISHRLYFHDAEHAVQEEWGSADLTANDEDMKKLALYVRSNFIMSGNGKPLLTKPVGTEIDGPYVWIYDEIEIPKKRLKTLTLENYILRDVWQDQANLVNVEIGNFTQSAFFAGKDQAKIIEIKKPKNKKPENQ